MRDSIDKSVYNSNELADTPSMPKLNEVRTRGRPAFKRKVSRVDAAIRWKKETIRKKINLHVF